MNCDKVAREIVTAITGELRGRKGFDDVIDSIDADVWVELEDALVQTVIQSLENNAVKKGDK